MIHYGIQLVSFFYELFDVALADLYASSYAKALPTELSFCIKITHTSLLQNESKPMLVSLTTGVHSTTLD
jgi:hypothetical protein